VPSALQTHADHSDVSDVAAWLRATFRLTDAQANRIASTASLRSVNPADSWGALTSIAQASGVDAAALVRKDAHLLTIPVDCLLSNTVTNAEALACNQHSLAKAATRHACVLKLPPSELQTRLANLSTLLRQPLPAVQRLTLQHPALVGEPAPSIAAKLSHLEARLALPFAQLVEVVISNPYALTRSSEHLDKLVASARTQLSAPQLTLAVSRNPWILNLAPHTFPQRVQLLQQFLETPPEVAASIVVRRPSLLRKAPDTVQRSFNSLRFLHYPREYLVEVVKAHPSLLDLSPSVVRARCLALKELLQKSKWYQFQAGLLPAKLLGVLLMHLDAAEDRLHFLADSKQEGQVSLVEAAQWRRPRAFGARFPLYQRWQEWKAAGGKVRIHRPT
jgi:hypothetical protein